MDDVGENGAIELVYFNSDGVRAVVGYRIKKITKSCPGPYPIWIQRREAVPVVGDAHHAALVDMDAGKRKVGAWFG